MFVLSLDACIHEYASIQKERPTKLSSCEFAFPKLPMVTTGDSCLQEHT